MSEAEIQKGLPSLESPLPARGWPVLLAGGGKGPHVAGRDIRKVQNTQPKGGLY